MLITIPMIETNRPPCSLEGKLLFTKILINHIIPNLPISEAEKQQKIAGLFEIQEEIKLAIITRGDEDE
jgi:hypothetical protein